MFKHAIQKPVHRGQLRKMLGREYFILRRRWQWLAGKARFGPRSRRPIS
jgi:hypothetical protein